VGGEEWEGANASKIFGWHRIVGNLLLAGKMFVQKMQNVGRKNPHV